MSGRPVLIICMGVSGCGKSTLGRALAAALGFAFIEGDDFHGAENRARMAAGHPLTDAMRAPWIERICERLRLERAGRRDCVLACSGLRRAQRQVFRELGFDALYLHLEADPATVAGRVARRHGHYMPAALVDSQFRDLQSPEGEPGVVALDAGREFAPVLDDAFGRVHAWLQQRQVPATPS